MATESERFRGDRTETGRESSGERREGTSRSPDTNRTVDVGADPAAIEAARARVMAVGASPAETPTEEGKTLFDFAKDAGSKTAKVGKGGLQILGGSLVVATYIGYQASRPVLFGTAHVLDWLGHKMNSWADKLIDKKIPVLSWVLNPVISFLDSFAKALGIDKTLAEHLKKNAQDRKKVAEKILKDFREAEKKQEKKEDDAKKKDTRRKKLEEVLGMDAAAVLEGELDDLEKGDAPAVAAPAAETAPAEAPKAA